MFENFAKRQRDTADWARPFGIVASLLTVGIALWRCSLDHDRSYAPQAELMGTLAEPSPSERIELPGMSIVGPHMTIDGTYQRGKATPLGFSPESALWVQWNVGTMLSDARLDDLVQVLLQKANAQGGFTLGPKRHFTLAKAPAFEVEFPNVDGSLLVIAITTCGGRLVQITSANTRRAPIDTTITSFRCKPDPAADLRRTEIVVDVRPGWTREDEAGLHLINTAGVEVLSQVYEREGDLTVADRLSRMLAPIGYTVRAPATTRGDKVFLTGTRVLPQGTVPFAVLGWRCGERIVGFVVLGAKPGASIDDGIALAETGRCLGSTEAMPAYPSAR